MNKLDLKIPKWFSEQYKALTGNEPTSEDFVNNTFNFKPRNKFEADPFQAIVILSIIGIVITWSIIVTLAI